MLFLEKNSCIPKRYELEHCQIYLTSRFSVVILHTISLFMPSSSAIIPAVSRQSLRTFSLTGTICLPVLLTSHSWDHLTSSSSLSETVLPLNKLNS